MKGTIVKLERNDGIGILYDDQPLIKLHKRIIITLCDQHYNPIKNDEGKNKTLLKPLSSLQDLPIIGYID